MVGDVFIFTLFSCKPGLGYMRDFTFEPPDSFNVLELDREFPWRVTLLL